jgi:acyl carrier protein
MSKIEDYKNIFIEALEVDESQLKDLKYQSVETWDSVAHMQLMTLLEEKFEIELDIDDIIDFSSFEKGKEIIGKYGVKIL